MPTPETDYYFRRFGFCERQIGTPPQPDLGIIVVIPCFNEPDLVGSLESLWLCDRPNASVEVIVVVNSPAGCSEEIRSQNQATLKTAAEWAGQRRDRRFDFHMLQFHELPPKQAGVGLARKIGMDEALRRFDDVGRLNGIIAGYDADCQCEPNYLTALDRHFRQNPRSPGCSIYFEHPLSGPLPPQVYEAVAAYELHLRYYVQALRYAGFPHSHHTIGSCMAVRAEAYRRQGGMNKRKAGEDFYFLHKIIALGGFTDLTGTTVHPSPRPSDRVPFGTGKAVRACLAGAEIKTYPLDAFLDLKCLFDRVPEMCRIGTTRAFEKLDALPVIARDFLGAQKFADALAEIDENTSSAAALHKRFFRWFDGFRSMKFIHYASACYAHRGRVGEQAARLLAAMKYGPACGAAPPIRDLLRVYRDLDRAAKGILTDTPVGQGV